METKKINIFKKGLIPFKCKISYTYFKGKLYIYPSSNMNFKKAFRQGFNKLFFMNQKDFNFLWEKKGNKETHTELYKNYYEFINQILRERKERKPLSKEAYKKQVEATRLRFKEKRKERIKERNELINKIPQINKLLIPYKLELYFKDYFRVKKIKMEVKNERI